MSKKIGKPIAKKIGPGKKRESLISTVSQKPTNDLKEHCEQLRQLRPKGIYSDIELLEERAKWALSKTGKTQEQYHSLSSQHQCAEKTLEHTELLRHAIENNDMNLAVYSAIRATEQAERIILHHWEYSARLGQGAHASQAIKGRKGAEVRWKSDEEDQLLNAIIPKLALKKDGLGDELQPSELWPLLYSGLDSCGLNPEEHIVDSPRNAHITYGNDGKISYESFRRRIQRKRKE
ncbi:MAG: hypothetical protein GY927_09385 [bacterium]|nr:hypothetical protein [bacterium]